MTLDELQIGQSASIIEVGGDDGIAIRLMEMGLTDGEEITPERFGQFYIFLKAIGTFTYRANDVVMSDLR